MFIRSFGVCLSTISGMSRQNILIEASKSNNYKKSEAMDIIEEIFQEGRLEGIKIAIYKLWQRGDTLEQLSDDFGYSIKEIQAIISEMKNLPNSSDN